MDTNDAKIPPGVLVLIKKEVAEQRAAYLGSPALLPEALGDLGGLLSFWRELSWLELPSGEPYQWHYGQRKVPVDQVWRQA
ncbi:jg10094 [Pararge aegeria aegeria]|uniref:Jg10094 protein n=1 Tax=Pararge aegeria aegeria TaxID=348720 RepID=A0A8S4SC98_9NEOP|nr:jg10094 [Pararge aegeria aegeria]